MDLRSMPARQRLSLFRGPKPRLHILSCRPPSGHKTRSQVSWIMVEINLGADKSVEANNDKERKVFFAAGTIGAYQGTLNPLICSTLVLFSMGLKIGSSQANHCKKLEVFQCQMGKRILRIPKHYANLLPRVVLQWFVVESPDSH